MIYGEYRGGRVRTQCLCRCDCGNVVKVVSDSLTSFKKTSCGCDTKERRIKSNRIDLVGKKFGRLTVTEMLWQYRPTKVKCLCECGNICTVANADLVSGHTQSCGCLHREVAAKSNTKDWHGVKSSYNIEFIEPYEQNSKGQWLWLCKCGCCGNKFPALPARVMSGHITSCGCRKRSSREELIRNILVENNISFSEQYRFPDCRYKNSLPFDFAIIKEDGTLSLLIEYDGKQHHFPIPFWNGEEGLEITRTRDNIKDTYCIDNNIQLLRLPYTLTDSEIKRKILDTIYP